MITEEYCSKEVTDLLKEKGFKCGATYSKGFVKDGDGFVGGLVRHEDKITHQMAMKWLREVHKLFVDISFQKDEDDSVTWFYMTWALDDRKRDAEEVDFASYEEAVEAAIKYCLTKVI